jgi:P27 family predicted phage terminase small subunit
LTPTARAEWARVFPALERAGVIRMTDRAALAAYCQAYGDWVEGRIALDKTTMRQLTTEGGRERFKLHARQAERAQDQMRRWAVELGLTPSARSRVRTDDARPKSLADELFGSVSTTNGKAKAS